MKLHIHRSSERGRGDYGWLRTQYSFSFANYYNPKRNGFGDLLVLNEDYIDSGKGFPMHPHNNMEIITIPLEGEIEHKDSMGNHGVIKAGEIQRMSAGTGVIHSEYNASDKELHLLQIWVLPKEKNIAPSYEQKKVSLKKDKLVCIASNKKNDGVFINQNASFYLGELENGTSIKHTIPAKQGAYVFVIDGKISLGKESLESGDSAEITDALSITLKAEKKSKILMINTNV